MPNVARQQLELGVARTHLCEEVQEPIGRRQLHTPVQLVQQQPLHAQQILTLRVEGGRAEWVQEERQAEGHGCG